MLKLSLTKVFRKSDVDALLRPLAHALGEMFALFDLHHQCLWGNPQQTGETTTLYYQDQAIALLKGHFSEEGKATIIQLLHYIIQTEYEKKQLAQDTLQKYEEVVFLSAFSNQIASCRNLKEMGVMIRSEIRQLINIDEIFIFLYDAQQDKLNPFIYKSETSLAHFQAIYPIVERILRGNNAEILDNVQQDPDYQPDGNPISPLRSLLCSPLTIQNKIIGVLGLAHHRTKYFSSTDLNLFSTLTAHVAAAIQTAQYYDTIKDYSQTLEKKVKERTLELELAKQKLEQVNQQLKHLAVYDELTQIPNRRYFTHYLEQEWRQCLRNQLPLSVILCDVDHFKYYNDFYGHQRGDLCLRMVADMMQDCVKRPSDVVARYGGEEFIVILPYTNASGANIVAQRIHTAFHKAQILHEQSPTQSYVTASLGVGTTIPDLHHQPSDLIKIADQALYDAKGAGRNQTCSRELCLQVL